MYVSYTNFNWFIYHALNTIVYLCVINFKSMKNIGQQLNFKLSMETPRRFFSSQNNPAQNGRHDILIHCTNF